MGCLRLAYNESESSLKVAYRNPGKLENQDGSYYPFGLVQKGISSQAMGIGGSENKTKYNGYEQQNGEFSDGSGLEWYDYKHRFYDNQIGRFFAQDELADEFVYYSPYQFAGNQVPNAIDLDGLEPSFPFKENINSSPLVASSTIPQGTANLRARMQAEAAPRPTPNYYRPESVRASTIVPKDIQARRQVEYVVNQIKEEAKIKHLLNATGNAVLSTLKNAAQFTSGVANGNTEDIVQGGGRLLYHDIAPAVALGGLGKGLSLGARTEVAVTKGNFSTYFGYNSEGVVKYAGITGRNAEIRFGEHAGATGTGKEFLRFGVEQSGLTKMEAKVWEQTQINTFGLGGKAGQGGQLLNKNNSIDPKKWNQFGIQVGK